jgi:tetratricopeptide (TPR) repeat protein
MEERRWGDALPHLDRLLHRDPEDASLLMDRALCLEETGRLHEARAGYEAALGQQPQNAELHYYYARVLARLRMTTAAMAHLTRALALDARLAELARAERAFRDFSDHPGFIGLVG